MSIANAEKGVVYPLIAKQAAAVVPAENIWLSASAGTGKTQVLTARVIRLLLENDVKPENLLCITFTKAGAAEMSERINRLLAFWVQMKGTALAADLMAIGADHSPEMQTKARRLFASVLDAPGSGLQILTIHSLCQSLLASFPTEAGLIPGFEPVEGRQQTELYQEALAEMIVDAEENSRDWLIQSLQQLSLDMGEERTQKFLQRCASAPDVMAQIPDDAGAKLFVRRHLGLDYDGSIIELLQDLLDDSVINRPDIIAVADMNTAWGGKRGSERAAKINEWLTFGSEERAQNLDMLHSFWSKGDGDPLVASKGYTPPDDAYAEIAMSLYLWTSALLTRVRVAEYADRLTPALFAGKAYAQYYQESKSARGLVDFDDMIRKTADLLNTSGMAEWVRYKLDRQIDHILVDEAQDTNSAQWDIIRALTDDFFSGVAAKGEKNRTVFAVGDYKQAIFGFQGTDPENYRKAGEGFEAQIQLAGKELQRLELAQSFRSTKPILDFVNAVITNAGSEKFGINGTIQDHYSEKSEIGMVELYAPVIPFDNTEVVSNEIANDEENWLSGEKRILSHRIAAYVRALVDEAPTLASTGKPLVPGDIMILLRSRGEMASFLVGQLHSKGVPVAGIDRLRLQQPLAVQDMLSVIRFVLQPDDDLSLACILVSPLLGWSQDDLLRHGYRGPQHKSKSLWQFLKSKSELSNDVRILSELLNQTDYSTIYHFLENILSGEIQGRKKFVARLGQEALVPIEELLNAALEFEQHQGGGVQKFLAWFERGDTEIKREGLISANEVRVMTVHGSKGLQAPVVIMADVTADPSSKKDRDYTLPIGDDGKLPLLPISKADKHGKLLDVRENQEVADLNEHFRLLYVAITRAEERLMMAGALGGRAKDGQAPENSWYNLLSQAMQSLGCVHFEDTHWGSVVRYGGAALAAKPDNEPKLIKDNHKIDIPKWLLTAAPQEQNPPRPLTPSQLDDDDYGEAPANETMRQAAQKGRLIHALFERFEGSELFASLAQARSWLEINNQNSMINNDAILADVQAVVENPQWAEFFGEDARAEVPLAAVVGASVITGRVDRLYIGADRIRILDFKTGRNVPKDPAKLPRAYLRQMAHYVAALETIFPGKTVEACLLFTHIPVLMELSDELLAPHRPV
jgi:ATP-dependent helicase/nuclease subunit A